MSPSRARLAAVIAIFILLVGACALLPSEPPGPHGVRRPEVSRPCATDPAAMTCEDGLRGPLAEGIPVR